MEEVEAVDKVEAAEAVEVVAAVVLIGIGCSRFPLCPGGGCNSVTGGCNGEGV